MPFSARKGHRILICVRGVCADPKLGRQLEEKLNDLIDRHGLADPDHPEHISCRLTNCLGVCEDGPIMIVHPEAVKYHCVDATALERIFQEHLLQNKPVAELRVETPSPRPIPRHQANSPHNASRRNSKRRK